ncbi:MAG: AAA family ATPase, partial [Myxococcota bacterium]
MRRLCDLGLMDNTAAPAASIRVVNPAGTPPGGIDNFAELVGDGYCFVDKTPLIRGVLTCPFKVQLITRPRRFGKTMNMNMLRAFFETPPEGTNTKALFDGLLVEEDAATMAHQGKYLVISLTLKSAKLPTWEEAYSELCRLIHEEIHRRPQASDWRIGEFERMHGDEWSRLLNRAEATQGDWRRSLQLLCKLLALHHNKDNPDQLSWTHPVVLIDEYDAPIHAAHAHSVKRGEDLSSDDSYYGRMIAFMRPLLSNALKGNAFLHKAVVTGILRVAKEDIFSGLNNLGVYGVLEDRFADSFGFTQAEVEELLRRRDMGDRLEAAREWYDGYRFGKTAPVTIYNPWSVVSFIADPTDPPQPHWVNTSGNELVRAMIEESGDAQDRADVETLLLGGSVEKDVSDSMALRDLPTLADALWSILLTSGYLTADPDGEPALFGTRLRVPNKEVQFVYRRLITGWFHKSAASHALPAALKALIGGDVAQFARHVTTLASNSLSYFDIGGSHPERVYHALVLGMLAYLSDAYRIRSNRESGKGRPDLLLLPRDARKPG